jgi:Na+-driven multidrug efflux pump
VPEGGESIDAATTFLRLFAPTLGFIGIQQVIVGTLRGAGATTAAMMQAVLTQWVMRFPLAYVLAIHTSLGIDGVWWAMAVANPIGAALTVIWFLRGTWRKKNLLEDVRLEEEVTEAARIEENIAS